MRGGIGRWLWLLGVAALALALREWAAWRLPVDFDEPTYFTAAASFAGAARAGDLPRFLDADTAAEHPALAKLVYAAVLLTRPAPPQPIGAPLSPLTGDDGPALRQSSVALGVLHVLLLALVSPPAGALLAVHSYAVKYTAQIYLEALPMLLATVCVLTYQRGRFSAKGQRREEAHAENAESAKNAKPRNPGLAFLASWREVLFLLLSAVALGLTAAGKYVYAVAGLSVAVDWLWTAAEARRRRWALALLGWGAVALLAFLAANPNLWPDPLGRLLASLGFHVAYAGGAHVAESGYPPWQPFVWLLTPQPVIWHPGIILVPLEPLLVLLALVGVPRMWRRGTGERRGTGGRRGAADDGRRTTDHKPPATDLQQPTGELPPPARGPTWLPKTGRRRPVFGFHASSFLLSGRVVVLWWLLGLAFTLLWPTKWPQYSLVMTAPMCLCAAEAISGRRRDEG